MTEGSELGESGRPQPRFVLPPEILYSRAGYAVWHEGVVAGPQGITFVLHVTLDDRYAEPGLPRDLLSDGWDDVDLPVKAVAALAYVSGITDSPHVGTGSYYGSELRRTYLFHFGNLDAREIGLEILVRPLGLHVRRTASQISAKRSVPSKPALPRALLQPELLHQGEGYRIWHGGVILGPSGIAVLVEATVASKGHFLDLDVWDSHTVAGEPLEVLARQRGAMHPVYARSSWTGGDRRSYRKHHQFGSLELAGLRLDFFVRPLGLRLMRVLAAS